MHHKMMILLVLKNPSCQYFLIEYPNETSSLEYSKNNFEKSLN